MHLTLKQVSISSFQENLVPKMKNILNAMKFSNWNSSSSLVINMIFETADLGLRVKAWTSLNSKLNAPDFFYIWQSEQIEHGNYEYINCN